MNQVIEPFAAVLERAIAINGGANQTKLLCEELAELQVAVLHLERGKVAVSDVASEIADVLIMIEQMKLIFKIDDAQVDRHTRLKLYRLEQRLAAKEST